MKKLFYLLLALAITGCQSGRGTTSAVDLSVLKDSLKIEQQLEVHNLAGFSLVVFEDYQPVYVDQWGVKSVDSKESIDENTAFSTASIAKPITALLCLLLEEKGLIDLDEPIDGYLERWHLPKSPFTNRVNPTWKHFLNHTAGTSQHGFADFYEGDELPSLKESLMGQLPRYDKEIEFLFEPGSNWAYSGGGYVIVQMALEDHFNRPIAELAEEFIFRPLGMENTTMFQPHEKGFLKNVALVHDEENKVIRTGLPITPQVAPSGLWSTPTDLAALAIEIQNALRNEDNKLISHSVAKQMTEVTALKDAVGGWSYGWQRSFGFHNQDWFMHNGSNTGVGGDVFASMSNGNGFVVLANGEKPNRFPVIDHTRKMILSLMDWQQEIPADEVVEIPLELKEKLVGTYGDFLYGQGFETKIVERDDELYVESDFFEHFLGKRESRLLYLKDGKFKIVDFPNLLDFDFRDGKVSSVTISKDGLEVKVPMTSRP